MAAYSSEHRRNVGNLLGSRTEAAWPRHRENGGNLCREQRHQDDGDKHPATATPRAHRVVAALSKPTMVNVTGAHHRPCWPRPSAGHRSPVLAKPASARGRLPTSARNDSPVARRSAGPSRSAARPASLDLRRLPGELDHLDSRVDGSRRGPAGISGRGWPTDHPPTATLPASPEPTESFREADRSRVWRTTPRHICAACRNFLLVRALQVRLNQAK